MPFKKKSKRRRNILNDERGSVSYFIVFVLMVIMLTFLFGVGIPFLQTFTVTIHGATDDLVDGAVDAAQNINDVNARTTILNSLNAQEDALQEQEVVYGSFIQYSIWIVIFLIALVLFMASRRDVEQGIG
jgi:predicted PurR-regulated permease PerM